MTAAAPYSWKRRAFFYGLILVGAGATAVIALQTNEEAQSPAAIQADRDIRRLAATVRGIPPDLWDKKSFELRSAVLQVDGSACIEYTAKNRLGLPVLQKLVRPGRSDTVWTSDGAPKEFADHWARHCATKGRDLTSSIQHAL